jgi:hypothetical protein
VSRGQRRSRESPLAGALELQKHPLSLGADQRASPQRLDEQQTPDVRVALKAPQQLIEGEARQRRPVVRIGRERPHPREHALAAVPVGGQETLFLALELLVEGDRRDARVGAQIGDAHRRVSPLDRQLDYRVYEPFALSSLQPSARHARVQAAIAPRGSTPRADRAPHDLIEFRPRGYELARGLPLLGL